MSDVPGCLPCDRERATSYLSDDAAFFYSSPGGEGPTPITDSTTTATPPPQPFSPAARLAADQSCTPVTLAALEVLRDLPVDCRSPSAIRVGRRVKHNDARTKWGGISFDDREAVEFREKLTAQVKALRMGFRGCNTRVNFPDHVPVEARSFAAPKYGTAWETFDITKHADYDAQLRAECERRRRREAAMHHSATAASLATDDAGGDAMTVDPGEQQQQQQQQHSLLWSALHAVHGAESKAKGVDDARLEEADRLQAALRREQSRPNAYQCFQPPRRARAGDPPVPHVIDCRESLESEGRRKAAEERARDGVTRSDVQYTTHTQLGVIEQDLLAHAARQREVRRPPPPPRSHTSAILPFFTSGVDELDPIPTERAGPDAQVQSWKELLR